MADDLDWLAPALEAAHLPAAMAAVAQLTGDASALKPEWAPTYNPFERGDIGVPEAEQAAMRALAVEVFGRKLRGELPPAKALGHADVLKAMRFVAGGEVPEQYLDFLIDELELEGRTSKQVDWAPQASAAAGQLRVLIIGAGMSGLLAAIRLSQAGVPFQVVEKNPDVGGTWFENTYPGCRVDSSNHIYSYSFEPNPHWPQHFSTQPVLLKYFQDVAERYDLRRHIRFGAEVSALDWDEAAQAWTATLAGGETLTANAVITAVGQLNRPNIPDIKGADSFAGPKFHSAQWRHDVDLTGKRVAVIGTGASAFQFVPEIVDQVAELTVFQRTPPWAFPAAHYHDDVPDALKTLMERVDAYAKWYRFYMFWAITDGFLPAMEVDEGWTGAPTAVGAANAELREMMAMALLAQTEGRDDLSGKVVPSYPLGGKRALLDNGVWIAALRKPHAQLETSGIREITAEGVVTDDGQLHAADVIIYGTGFQASRFLTPMRITGRDGVRLRDRWAGDARAYLGMTVPQFPNLFMLYGPNTNIVVNGSIVFFSECSVRYVLGALELLASQGGGSMEVREDVHDRFNERVDAGNLKMAWGAPQSSSWYKNSSGRVSQNWPFKLVDYWQATLKPEPADFLWTPGGGERAKAA